MQKLNIKYLRIIFMTILVFGFSMLISEVYFLVTNSNLLNIIPPGQIQLGFENEDLDFLDYNFSGTNQWDTTQTNSYTGNFSFKSGNVSNNESSTFSISANILEDGYILFYYKVESEYSTSGDYFYDGLEFYIDGELINQFQPDTDGESEWDYYISEVSAGPHTFSWTYIKDNADGNTFDEDFCDCAWIDNISLPLSDISENIYEYPDPQNMSSGLFSAFVHPLNSQSSNMKAKGGALADFDLDGDLDLYYGYISGHYFENNDGFFIEKTDEYEINDSGSRGIVVGDVDNNGYPDILKWRYYFSTNREHYLLLNQGNHNFTTVEYLDSQEMRYLHSQGFIDFDLDGDLDIIAVEKENQTQFYCYSLDGFNDDNSPIYNLAFSYDRDDEESSSRTLAIADFDGDGDQDVYVPRKNGSNWLFENQTLNISTNGVVYNNNPNPLFIEVSNQYGIADEEIFLTGSAGYGAAWGDYDNDQDMDLYLSNWGKNRLFRNDNEIFTNVAQELDLESDSLSNGAGWGDFDNNGNLDIWAANFKREDDLFLNTGTNTPWDNSYRPFFASATQDVIPVDYNNDGWLDMFTPGLEMAHGAGPTDQMNKFTSLLYQNISPDSIYNSNNWVFIRLEGSKNSINNQGWTTKSNKSAIGARVKININNNNFIREVIAGKGHGSMDPLQLHFGLGNNNIIDQIIIYWPSMDNFTQQQKITIYNGPFLVNTWYTIVEDLGFVGKKGDLNNDEIVNVLDIVMLVNEIIFENQNFDPIIFWAANLDYSESLDILDVIKMVSFAIAHQ